MGKGARLTPPTARCQHALGARAEASRPEHVNSAASRSRRPCPPMAEGSDATLRADNAEIKFGRELSGACRSGRCARVRQHDCPLFVDVRVGRLPAQHPHVRAPGNEFSLLAVVAFQCEAKLRLVGQADKFNERVPLRQIRVCSGESLIQIPVHVDLKLDGLSWPFWE